MEGEIENEGKEDQGHKVPIWPQDGLLTNTVLKHSGHFSLEPSHISHKGFREGTTRGGFGPAVYLPSTLSH